MKTLKPRVTTLLPLRLKSQTRTVRITGSRLVKIRQEHFKLNPLCVACEALGFITLAEELDHTIPLWMGGKDEPSNRQGLCCPCHAAKTAQEARLRAGGTTEAPQG